MKIPGQKHLGQNGLGPNGHEHTQQAGDDSIQRQPAPVVPGQWFFSIMSHRLYDLGLYRLVTPYIWQCSTAVLLDNYVDNVSDTHLEVGVGSGFLLKQTLCADFVRRLVLLDLNERCLAKSMHRLRDLRPQAVCFDITRPPEPSAFKFRSVGMNYVLHCIAGGFLNNQPLFKHISAQLEEGGVFFGATLLPKPASERPLARVFMGLLNFFGVFRNQQHDLAELKAALRVSFREADVSLVGSAAVFRAVK